jgi:hypothetical protein
VLRGNQGRFASTLAALGLLGSLGLPVSARAATTALLFGSEAGGQFGQSVCDAGDFNGDGVADLLAGAPLDDTGGLARGRAFLWLGGAGLRRSADFVFSAGNAGDHFGWSVAGVGDVNGDGYDDIAIGAPLNDAIGQEAGAVYLFFGGQNPDTVVDLTLHGEEADDRFGWSVRRAGDMNRDGRDDFAVGAPWADVAGQDVGAVYLWYGASGTPSSSYDLRFLGEAGGSGDPPFISGPGFGFSLADLDGYRGDSRSSLAVGAPYYAGSIGRVYLFFDASLSGNDPSTTAGTVFTNNIANELFGYALSRAGRIGNSSRDDLLVGGPGAFGDTGYVKIFYGDATPAATVAAASADLTRNGETGGDRFGEAVADVGNFDGSGGDDYAVAAPSRNEPSQDAGRVYLYSGTSSSPTDVAAVNGWGNGSEAGDLFGHSLSAVGGDLDGDGREDLLIGSPKANDPSNVVQGAMVVLGSGVGVVPVARVLVEVTTGASSTEFAISGLGPDLLAAQLRDATAPQNVLADLDHGFQWRGETWVVSVESRRLVDVGRVELTWEDGFGVRSQEVAVPETVRPRLRLLAARPNPFNPTTTIRWELDRRESYRVRIYDARGRQVRELESGIGGPGKLEAGFDGRDDAGRFLASGVYRVLLTTPSGQRSQALTLVE